MLRTTGSLIALLMVGGCGNPSADGNAAGQAGATAPTANVASAAPAGQAEGIVYAKDGAIGLKPLPGMTEASDFSGFMDAASGASITVTEMPPQVYAASAGSLDASQFLAHGMTLDGQGERIRLRDGSDALFFRATQTTPRGPYVKRLLIAKGPGFSALVAGQAPEAKAAELGGPLEAALRSVVLRAPKSAGDSAAALPFTIGDRAGFRLVRTLMGSSAFFTDGPKDTDPEGTQPLVIVAASLAPGNTSDHQGAARRAFASLPPMADVRVTQEGPSADGRDYRIAATAKRRGRPVGIVQHMRFGATGGYVRTVCLIPTGVDITARCDAFATSVQPKP